MKKAFVLLALTAFLCACNTVQAPPSQDEREVSWQPASASSSSSSAHLPSHPLTQPLVLPIIMYHYVEHVQDANDHLRQRMNISPEILESQLTVFQKSGYETVFLRDVPSFFDGTEAPPPQTLVLTFDDGYEDFYEFVLPILKKYHAKATLFVISHAIGTKDYLSEQQLREILSSGLVEIAAHTQTHPHLDGLSVDEATKEIVTGKKELETMFGVPMVTFAYPYGGYNAHTVEIVKKAGFSAAVSTDRGVTQSSDRLFTLYRVPAGAVLGPHMMDVLKGK